MDMTWTEEELLLQRTLRDYAQQELLPHYGRWDKGEAFPREKMRELGALETGSRPATPRDITAAATGE